MATKYEQVAVKALKKVSRTVGVDLRLHPLDPKPNELVEAIAAILRDEFGPMEEAIHAELTLFCYWAATGREDGKTIRLPNALIDTRWEQSMRRMAQLVNRWHDNGDGTGRITERKE